jgi:2-C-methyl-D-erythritol 4-phosphate cytidylyltransferase
MQYCLVLPAAGRATRFGGGTPKQHLPFAGTTVLETALKLFIADPRCQRVVLALAHDDQERMRLRATLESKVQIIDGGAERADSVRLALQALKTHVQDSAFVLVHDAARPLLSPFDLSQLLTLGADAPDGALLASPVPDTLKRSGAGKMVVETVRREPLWRAQTPQMFRFGALTAALTAAQSAGRVPTDESQAIEWQGGKPLLVAARDSNIKITTADDLAVAQAIWAARWPSAGPVVNQGVS